MSKVRVYEVARELGLQNRDLIQRIAALGIQVRNHMSVLDQSEVDRVKRSLSREQGASMVEERIRPTVVRRRKKDVKKVASAPTTPPTPVVEAAPEPPVVEEPVVNEAPPPVPNEPTISKEELQAQRAEAALAEARRISDEAERRRAEAEAAEQAAIEAAAAAEAAAQEAEAERLAKESETPPAFDPTKPNVPPAPPMPSVPVDLEPAEPLSPEEEKRLRFADPHLPPGVVGRGKTQAPGAAPLSEAKRKQIVAAHAANRPQRRREIRPSLGGGPGQRRGGARPGKKRLSPGKKGKQTEITVPSAAKRKIRIEDQIQLQMLAQRMSLKSMDVLMKLMQMGVSNLHINSTLDADTAMLLAEEFGYEVENVAMSEDQVVVDARGDFVDSEDDREVRPPIVTVMGHVDHGKTSLLDKIRSAKVASGEAGGITQHIGAYRVETGKGTVVFLDTPGHEAFTAMRARGAQATDIVILVVAADDGVMPQTREAVSHSQAAEVPIVVAVNKIDRPDAQSDKVMNELAALGLQPEAWGGTTTYIPTSAHTGQGIDDLLDNILLQAEMLELSANEKVPAEGVVLEAKLDRGRGPVAHVLVRDGTLSTGDYVVAGGAWGRVRAMTDDRGNKLKVAGPATPLEVLGLQDVPQAGDTFYKVTSQKKAQEVAERFKKQGPSRPSVMSAARGLDQLQALLQSGDVKELNLVIKADVQGSVEAVTSEMLKQSTEKVKVNVILAGAGGITENDIMLASASNAIVIGFNVRPQGKASSTSKKENVEVRTYSVIYEAIDDVKAAMAGLLAPRLVEKELGKAEVREVFTIPKIGAVAGCMVTDGKIVRSSQCRLVRDAVVVWEGQLQSLRRIKDDVKEVPSGLECGIRLQGYNDIKQGDVIECFEHEEVAATL